jgi:tRNA nucleotidyltransferase (CCA-adding enzyme)
MSARVPTALARAQFPPSLLTVLRVLDGAGHRSWLVGGAVRDLLLHRPREASDFDVATPAHPRQVMKLFRRVIPTGVEHGTVTVLLGSEKVEVTTFRGEGAYTDGRRPESVAFHTDLTADLARRDFTMNALAYDPIDGEFRDPFDGRADLKRRLIRTVGDPAARFGEDGLRPVRAVRFSAQLGYRIEKRTLRAIPGSLPVVRKVSIERISSEMSRILTARYAPDALELLRSTGLLGIAFPALEKLPAGRLLHAFQVVKWVDSAPVLRFAALLHLLTAKEAEKAMAALRLPTRIAAEVAELISHSPCLADRPFAPPPTGPTIRRWLSQVGPKRVPFLFELATADARALGRVGLRSLFAALRRFQTRVRRELDLQPPLSVSDLALDGKAVMHLLGTSPGPHIGEALQHLLLRTLEEPELNTAEKLASELRSWKAREGV